ncbi:hypothetical protein [Nonlabens sp. YIK11]|uniref:hypothetical protein n=1 Tax=Nonlabens sp. YIK11 TaxID=1453349 RepID=UPI000A9ACE37|nr:hypothetical protein [Nonlabens sp. YIK11]
MKLNNGNVLVVFAAIAAAIEGGRVWIGSTGNPYVKKGGNGRGGPTVTWFNRKNHK